MAFSVGDYVQFSPGEAPPEDWAMITLLADNTALCALVIPTAIPTTVMISFQGNKEVPAKSLLLEHQVAKPLSELYPIEATVFKELVKQMFVDTLNSTYNTGL